MSNAAAAVSCAARSLTLAAVQTVEEKLCLQSVSLSRFFSLLAQFSNERVDSGEDLKFNYAKFPT